MVRSLSRRTNKRIKLHEIATELEWLRFFRDEVTSYLGAMWFQERIVKMIAAKFEKKEKKRCPENLPTYSNDNRESIS